MATLPLRNVPFDIWENVFDKLDHATLCALCLVSHDVYEVASPILYRTMIWRPISRSPWTNVYKDEALHRTGIEGEPTIAAFLRRPSLRTHVRIIIFTRGNIATTWTSVEKFFECAKLELSLIPSVVRLEWFDGRYELGVSSARFMLLASAMESLKSLQEIIFPSVDAPTVLSPSLTRRLKRITFAVTNYYSVKLHTSPWFLSTSGHLEALSLKSEIGSGAAHFLSNFCKLRILRLGRIAYPAELVASLRPMLQLRELCFSIRLTETDTWQLQLGEPLRLEYLRILSIELGQNSSTESPIPRLRRLYECLASNSKYVEEVHLPHDSSSYASISRTADKILTDILHFHPKHIRCLRFQKLIISSQFLLKIGLQLPCLQELELFTDGEEVIPLLSILRIAPSLEVLRATLTQNAEWPSDRDIKAFMIQEMTQLRRLHLRQPQSPVEVVGLWESHWVYDTEQKEGVRTITKSTDPRKYDP